MQRIHLLRNTYLAAYLKALRGHGVDPEPVLARYGIPRDFEFLSDYMLAAQLLHQFIDAVVGCLAPGALSSAAGLHNAAYQPNPFSESAWQSISLADAIHQHNANLADYSPENRFDLSLEGGMGYWMKKGLSPGPETETFCVANMVGHVRSLLGIRWQPRSIQVAVTDPVILRALPLHRGVEISVVRGNTAIAIPAPSLSNHTTVPNRRAVLWRRINPRVTADVDFVETLRLVMKSYARTGDLSIDTVATAAGTSRRTLQRQLSSLKVSFSSLADQVRFEVASTLLTENLDLSVTQVGYELGYQDPGSFTRAFRRFAGMAPSTYRRHIARAGSRTAS